MYAKAVIALFASLLVSQVAAHGVLTEIKGANGVSAQGFGVIESTPRDGSKNKPFQQDSSIIRDRELASGRAGPCGRTQGGGNVDIAKEMQSLLDATGGELPSASSDGSVTMTLHQVNGDGAGPYTCGVSADGTGQSFVDMTVTKNVPGKNSRSKAKAEDFELVAQMPAGTACSGGPAGNGCLVMCRNAARAGPFGGCAMVTDGAAGAAASGNATAAGASDAEEAAPKATKATKGAATKANKANKAANNKRELSDADILAAEIEEAQEEGDVAPQKVTKRFLTTRVSGAIAGSWA